MKQLKKIVSLTLVCAIMLIATSFMHFGVTAAEQEISSGIQLAESPYALASVRGRQIPVPLSEQLSARGYKIQSDTLIEVLPSNAGEGATILVITNSDGQELTKDMLIAIGHDGAVGSFLSYIGVSEMNTRDSGGQNVDIFNNSTFIATFTATYRTPVSLAEDLRATHLIQPVNVKFKYSDNSNTHTVTRVYASHCCSGFELTYPGLEQITVGPNMFLYEIILAKNNPRNNNNYTRTAEYRSDRVISVFSGNSVYHLIDWELVVDGRTYADVITLTQT